MWNEEWLSGGAYGYGITHSMEFLVWLWLVTICQWVQEMRRNDWLHRIFSRVKAGDFIAVPL